MTINTVDSYRQRAERHNAEKTGRGQAKPSNEQNADKQAQAATEQEAKKDSVEISEQGRTAAERNYNIRLMTAADFTDETRQNRNFMESIRNILPEKGAEVPEPPREHVTFFGEYGTPSSAEGKSFSPERYLAYVLYGAGMSFKDSQEISKQLGSMLFHEMQFGEPDANGTRYGIGKEGTEASRAADREAGRKLAETIAQKYFSDPKEAQAFMDRINKFIKNDELSDLGWLVRGADDNEPRDLYKESHEFVAKNKNVGFSEKGKELNAIYESNVKNLKDIFANAKLITNFSSNQKWNIVINLLK